MLTINFNEQLKILKLNFNSISVDLLFEKYYSTGFIYKAKEELLEPYKPTILKNWQKLLNSKDQLLWIFTTNKHAAHFASVCAWRNTNFGVLAQHLVSEGNPFMSLRLMLAAQIKAAQCESPTPVHASQNWYRQDNRYAHRIFSSMVKKLGPLKSSMKLFYLLKLPIKPVEASENTEFIHANVTGIDASLIDFVDQQFGRVFTQAEELDREDICQTALSKKYKDCGLLNTRKVIKFIDQKTNEIKACLIANRASIGINFSFIENRAYYIVDKNLSEEDKRKVVSIMNEEAQKVYKSIAIKYVPITTEAHTAKVLQSQGAEYIRQYVQSIWLRTGFDQWYDHINSFLQKIEGREVKIQTSKTYKNSAEYDLVEPTEN